MKENAMELTIDYAKQILSKRFGGILKAGKHNKNGECCVRELTSILRGMEWTDDPDKSPFDAAARALNDAGWSDDAARTAGCLRLALVDGKAIGTSWIPHYVKRTIQEIVPLAMKAAATACPQHTESLRAAGRLCAEHGDRNAAAAAATAARAAGAAALARAGEAGAAALATADAAGAAGAARAAGAANVNGDEVLLLGVKILIEEVGLIER